MSKAHHHGGKGAKGGKGSSSASKGGGKGGGSSSSSSFFHEPPPPPQITRVIHADGDTRNSALHNIIVKTDGELAVTDADLATAVRVEGSRLLRTQKGLFCRTDGAVVPTQVGEDGEPRPILGPFDA
jgi:hypothetical protein